MNASEPREDAVAEWRKKLEWAAEHHITREYRSVTLGEHEARQIIAALAQQGAEPVAWQYRYLDPVEGPGLWSECREQDVEHFRCRPQTFELRALVPATGAPR